MRHASIFLAASCVVSCASAADLSVDQLYRRPPPAAEVVIEPAPRQERLQVMEPPRARRFLGDAYWGSYRPWWGPNCYWRYGYYVCRP